MLHGCSVTAGLLPMRFTLPDVDLGRESCGAVRQTDDPDGRRHRSPFWRKVVSNTYFSSVMATTKR